MNRLRRRMIHRPILASAVLAALFLAPFSCTRNPSDDEVRAMMEIVDVETKWVSKYYQPWPPRLILVPSVSFRVKNLTEEPLKFIIFNAIFQLQGERDNLGDNFLAAIRNDPVPPGGLSKVIHLKSNFGVEGKTLASFKDNPQWKLCNVKIFTQTRGSRHVLLGEWQISRQIDFKEPEPVGMEKKD